MARDRNGRDHKASGRPDGGQYEGKAGQGSDDDLVEVPTTAKSVAPDEGWWASLENDPEATVGPEVGEEPGADGQTASKSVKSGDKPWWDMEESRAPEIAAARRTVMDARSQEEAAGILRGLSDDYLRGAVIRSLPFNRKITVADLTPDPDEEPDVYSLIVDLPYSADDVKDEGFRDLVAKGDARASVALAAYGDDGDRKWLASLPAGKRPVVEAVLRIRTAEPGMIKDAKNKKPAPEAKLESEKPSQKPTDPIADMAEKATHAANLWEARKLVSAQPRTTRVAVIRAMPFSRRALMADLTGDPDKACSRQSLLDMLPYTKDSPADRLRDMASRGDVRAAAALAAYGGDDARRWLATLPVGDHRAVQLALRAQRPPKPQPAPKPVKTPKSAPESTDRAKDGAVTSKPAGNAGGVRSFRRGWSAARYPAKPRKPSFRERARAGLSRLGTIWSGVWVKWAAVFRRQNGTESPMSTRGLFHEPAPGSPTASPTRSMSARIQS